MEEPDGLIHSHCLLWTPTSRSHIQASEMIEPRAFSYERLPLLNSLRRLPDPLGIYCFLRDTGIICTPNHEVLWVREVEDYGIGVEPPVSVVKVDPWNRGQSSGGGCKRSVISVPCAEIGFTATSNLPSSARERKAWGPVAKWLDRVTVVHYLQEPLSILASAMVYLYDLG